MSENFDLIYNELQIDDQVSITDEQMLQIISDRVLWLLENDKELLLSYLYRLDVEERKIDVALSPAHTDPAHLAIARLIFDRQKQRVLSKTKYKVKPIEGWEY